MFTCYTSMWDVIFHGELGSSLAVLKGGYNLESFMARYRGVDWRQESNWECNSRPACTTPPLPPSQLPCLQNEPAHSCTLALAEAPSDCRCSCRRST